MDICVRCGARADKCHFFPGSGDPKNMPVLRAELPRSVYRREFTIAGKILRGLARRRGTGTAPPELAVAALGSLFGWGGRYPLVAQHGLWSLGPRAGLRIGEALSLKPGDLHPGPGTITLKDGKTGPRTVACDPGTFGLLARGWPGARRSASRGTSP